LKSTFWEENIVGLKFGYLFSIRNPRRWEKPWPQVYGEMLEQVQAAEDLGFDSVWMSEHHGADDGYCPSTLVAAAAAAVRTSRITIGIRLLLLPMHHPVRVAEDAAVVDNLAHGRFVLGMAVGYVPSEYGMFGVNRRYRPSLMDEGVEIIRRCWTEDRFDYEGKRFSLRDVAVRPKPFQKPHPPIWLGAARGGAIDRVARMADGFHFVGTPEVYADYAAAMQRHGRDPLSIPVYDSRECWVGEDSELAWQEAKDHLFYSYSYYTSWGAAADAADAGSSTGETATPRRWMSERMGEAAQTGPGTTPEEMRQRAGTMLFVGNPEEIVAMFKQRLEDVPINGTIMRVPPGMDHQKVLRCMELVAREVVPHFRDT
jgi:alkanesulfonate monooxygenase SsuD/methylene tetrahydromethanopterin reductase-like flavin-dependent oxidoreductase (luciferase family)